MNRVMMAGFVAAVVLMGSAASAQDTNYCKQFSDAPADVSCTSVVGGVGTDVTPVIHRFGEGVVNAPGSEQAFLTIANYNMVPVSVLIRALVNGRTGVISEQVTIPAQMRISYPLHVDSYIVTSTAITTFSLRAYAPDDNIDISLVLRPVTNFWAHPTFSPMAIR